jgi:hypothetical protein
MLRLGCTNVEPICVDILNCNLFNHFFSRNSDYMASNERVIIE